MNIRTFYFNPFRVCTYVINDTQNNAVIIDAGCQTVQEKERLATYIHQNNLQVRAHLLTHGHLDHLMGARFVYEQYDILPHLSPVDEWYFNRQNEQSAAFGCPLDDEPLQEYIALQEPQTTNRESRQNLRFGNLCFHVLPTPGHTQGGVCYLLDSLLFAGDTLFAGGIGRTDLPGGDYATLIRSIQKQILPLPDSTIIYPGHGYDTTLGIERTENPYI